MRVFTRHSFERSTMAMATSVALLGLAACTPFTKEGEPPVAVAGHDQMLSGANVEVTLDGSESYDPDGVIVGYEWRYTGEPAGYESPDDEDAGVEDPLQDLLEPLPEFCAEPDESDHEVAIPARYCLLAVDGGGEPVLTLSLPPGGYRFTLWVTDDDGRVGADTVDVVIGP